MSSLNVNGNLTINGGVKLDDKTLLESSTDKIPVDWFNVDTVLSSSVGDSYVPTSKAVVDYIQEGLDIPNTADVLYYSSSISTGSKTTNAPMTDYNFLYFTCYDSGNGAAGLLIPTAMFTTYHTSSSSDRLSVANNAEYCNIYCSSTTAFYVVSNSFNGAIYVVGLGKKDS